MLRAGVVSELLERGVRYAMIADAANLGARPDPRIVAYMSNRGIEFLLEVVRARRGERDGGRVARLNGTLVVRERAHVPPGDEASIDAFRLESTGTVWVALRALLDTHQAHGGLPLPVMLEPRQASDSEGSRTSYRITTTVAPAVALFTRPSVLVVPRTRFMRPGI